MYRRLLIAAAAVVLTRSPATAQETYQRVARSNPANSAAQTTARAALDPTAPTNPVQGLDAYIQKAMRDWGGAGLAIAVVKDDSIVFARGYGVREVGKPDPVTPRSLFAIGSNTKLFSAVAAGMLVDDGKMKWDAPITTYLPDFQLYDPYVTREFTLRDALSHRSGLGRRGDFIWLGSNFDRREVIRRARYLVPTSSFRSQYGYQNIMVMSAGEATAAAAGMSWDDLVERRIFQPLGMAASSTSIAALAGASDVAQPHVWANGKPVVVPYRNIDNIAPAGSINSNVLDMAQWLRLLLADGKYGGKQLIKSKTLAEITAPTTIVSAPPDTLKPSTHFRMYGLGVGMSDYMGVKVLTHTGGIDGMLSQVTWIPEKKLGVVILTNTAGHNSLYTALAERVVDAYLGAPVRDWSAIRLAETRRMEARMDSARKKMVAERAPNTKPSLALEKYAGTYVSELYPDLVVKLDDGTLTMHLGTLPTTKLEHWQYNSFLGQPTAPGDDGTLINFSIDARGKVTRADVQGVGTFERKESDAVTAARR
jgi:CubicO group peptidase (beta-lactamase class C family)